MKDTLGIKRQQFSDLICLRIGKSKPRIFVKPYRILI